MFTGDQVFKFMGFQVTKQQIFKVYGFPSFQVTKHQTPKTTNTKPQTSKPQILNLI